MILLLLEKMEKKLEKTIASLEVQTNKVSRSFQFRNEEEVGNFSGIIIEKKCPDEFYLTQLGTTEKVVQAGVMSNANEVTGDPLGADLEGTAFNEEWEYRSNCWNSYIFSSKYVP